MGRSSSYSLNLFIPGYPYGMTYGFTVGSRNQAGREDWKVYYDNSILAKGTEMQQLIDCAKRLGVYVSIGYSERDEVTATLYNSNMMISPQGEALNHRKLKPTGSERVVWGDGNKDFFPVMDTPWGGHGQSDLLGKLHASGPGGPLPKRDHHLYFSQHQ